MEEIISFMPKVRGMRTHQEGEYHSAHIISRDLKSLIGKDVMVIIKVVDVKKMMELLDKNEWVKNNLKMRNDKSK